jgi:hypothetical protein
MRFMLLMIPGGYETAGPELELPVDGVEKMMAYNQSLVDAGILRSAEGLHPPAVGKRVSFAGGKPLITDGPFAESKEALGGFWIIEVASLEEAAAWAARCPARENEVIEIRRIQEMEDFSPDVREVAKGLDLEGSGWSRA